jgi:hypothetical protein
LGRAFLASFDRILLFALIGLGTVLWANWAGAPSLLRGAGLFLASLLIAFWLWRREKATGLDSVELVKQIVLRRRA